MRYLLVLFLAVGSFANAQVTTRGETPLVIDAKPIPFFDKDHRERTRFGKLEFRGGLVLTSSDVRFGGLSALNMEPDGEGFLAISDRGYWLRGRIAYDDGRLAGVRDAMMTPILDDKREPASSWDTESLTRDGDVRYIGIERIHQIARYDLGTEGFGARGKLLETPDALRRLPSNKSLESLVFVPGIAGGAKPDAPPHPLAGAFVAVSEGGIDAKGGIQAFIIGGPAPGTFSVKQSGKLEISDATLLPDGDLLLLERHYSVLEGLFIRVRRIARDDIAPGAVVDGEELMSVNSRCEIDNMEALSFHKNAAGDVILTLLSDNNYSPIQRTLLLQFALKD
ncbi:MAG: esterase-like activity of phytase family protein [Acidobacteriota bacterium]|jgi:hypothetical protein|nr:esterase-like activity of phytase family protein [Acidobacteriota bacterium]